MLRRGARLALGLVLAALGPLSCGSAGGPPTLNFYIFNEPSGAFQKAADTCSEQSGGRYKVQLQLLPASADGQRQQLVRRLAAQDSSIDIIGMDVVWTAEFAEAHWIKAFPDSIKEQITKGTLETSLKTATWKGTLYAAPDNTNTQLLWYRKDLVQSPPKTWSEMIDQAKQLADAGKPHYIEIQGAQYEGFTVWFNSLVNSAGGKILDDKGGLALDQQPVKAAAKVIKDLADSPAADPSLSNQKEDDTRLGFESGKAPFELNYPFIYPSAKKNKPDLFKDLAWAPYPSVGSDQQSHVTIGGINLGVGAYSSNPDLAFEAAACMRNSDNQKFAAIKGGLPPTLEALYDDSSLRKEYPFADTIREALKTASVRPQTPQYTDVSLAIQTTLSPPGSADPGSVLDTLKNKISDAVDSKGLVP